MVTNNIPPKIEQLLMSMARTNYWATQYGPAHPATLKHIRSLLSDLSACMASEPGNILILGVARDRFYYRDGSIGKGNEVINAFTGQLYVAGVATVSFGPHLCLSDLTAFFDFLYKGEDKNANESFDQYLLRVQATGIQINRYNYKELLSRKTGEIRGVKVDSADREDFLLRSLIFSYARGDEKADQTLVDEIAGYPELLAAILERAKLHEEAGGRGGDGGEGAPQETIPPEILGRLLQRLGGTMKSLPEDRKKAIMASLGSRQQEAPMDLFIAKSLTEGFSSDEFLDLMGMVLSAEEKTSNRFRNSFQVLAEKRNDEGSLLTSVSERMHESRKARDFYALKTWEAVENLLLSRADDAYIEKDHENFLEYISSEDFKNGEHASRTVEPGFLESLSQDRQHRKTILVYLELIREEGGEETFYDLAEELRKVIPNLVSRRDIPMLETVIYSLSDLSGTMSAGKGKVLQDIVARTDFGEIVDQCLQNLLPPDAADAALSILGKCVHAAAPILLGRLLSETVQARRRLLMKILAGLGPEAAPALIGQLSHPRWYFVRNVCTALGDIGDSRAVPGLLAVIGHEDWRVRREAIAALGKLRSRDAVPVLGNVLAEDRFFSSQEEESVRLAAASALFQIGGSGALQYLDRGSRSRRAAVREFCAYLSNKARKVS